MLCGHCGVNNSDEYKYCIGCGQPLAEGAEAAATLQRVSFVDRVLPKRRRALAISIAVSVVLLAALILVLVQSANPVAGRWYAQDGTGLLMLENGKGMTLTATSGEEGRIHFMYAVGYRQEGYAEGQIYETTDGEGAWFYLYDGVLEFDGQYYYRQQPKQPALSGS